MKKLLPLLFLLLSFSQAKAQGTKLIKSVFFGGGSSYIDPQQILEIEEFIQSVPNIRHYQVIVSSHTDNIGGVEYNRWLSGKRSDSVMEELRRLEISDEKVVIQDNGQENPFFDNDTFKGQRANRRVDIILSPLYL